MGIFFTKRGKNDHPKPPRFAPGSRRSFRLGGFSRFAMAELLGEQYVFRHSSHVKEKKERFLGRGMNVMFFNLFVIARKAI